MEVEYSLKKFPATGELKKQCGIPFGVAVQPLARQTPSETDNIKPIVYNNLARCSECFSYINPLCIVDSGGFICSLCTTVNNFPYNLRERYLVGHQRLPEFQSNYIEVDCEEIKGELNEEIDKKPFKKGTPIYIAIIDTLCDELYLEQIKTAVLAALDALPGYVLFGLITFDDRVKMYNVRNDKPVCRSVALLDRLMLLCPLEDIIPLKTLLVLLGSFKDKIIAAIETLSPNTCGQSTKSQNNHESSKSVVRGQGFGIVLQAILQYLQPLQGNIDANMSSSDILNKSVRNARILNFLCGPPTLGEGNLLPYVTAILRNRNNKAESIKRHKEEVTQEGEQQIDILELETGNIKKQPYDKTNKNKPSETKIDKKIQSEAVQFYDQVALVAASLGLTMDLFVLSKELVGVEILKSLAKHTGGGLWVYSSPQDSMIAQDLYRHLSVTCGHSCLLRIRTTPEFFVSNRYGKLFPDPIHEDICHIMSCDIHDTFCFDFEHKPNSEIHAKGSTPPLIQIAFQYSVVNTDRSQQGSFRIRRRMRIGTYKVNIATTPRQVYNHINPSVVMALLLHKVEAAREKEGVVNSAILLQDWLIIVAVNYIKNTPQSSGTFCNNNPEFGKFLFNECDALQQIGRMVYGFLRSPLLLGGLDFDINEDYLEFLRYLWSSLPLKDLKRAIYPNLSSYYTPDQQAYPQHSLSNAAMQISDAHIFLLDAFTSIFVFYTSVCSEDLAYPPPHSSLLRSMVRNARQSSKITPTYTVLKGDGNKGPFLKYLLDEPCESTAPHRLGGEAHAAYMGYMSYLEWIAAAARGYLQTSSSA